MNNIDEFLNLLWARLGVPATLGRMEFGREWARWEGTAARFNPFATTLNVPDLRDAANPFFNDIPLDNGNVIHVMNYKDIQSGVEATARTILQGNFAVILDAIRQERITLPELADVMSSTWGTSGFARILREGWIPTGWGTPAAIPDAPAPVTRREFEDLVLALFSGAEERDAQGVTLGRAERLPVALYRMKEAAEGRKRSVADVAYSSEAAAPGGSRVPPHVHELNLVVTQTGGAR